MEELTKAGLDVPELKERLMGNTALIPMFVKMFLQDGTYVQLRSALSRQDYDQALAASHTLKGLCGNLSLKELYQLFQEQVALFRAGRPEDGQALMARIAPLFDDTTARLKAWVDSQ